MKNTYCVYILLCNNGNYYTGYTTDLPRRYQEHLSGSAKCKYTRSFKPLAIAQSWQLKKNKSLALKLERYIKSLSKAEKEQLISNPETLTQHFSLTSAKPLNRTRQARIGEKEKMHEI